MLHPHIVDTLFHFFHDGAWMNLLATTLAITGLVFITTLVQFFRKVTCR